METKHNISAVMLSAAVCCCEDSPKQGQKWHRQSAGNLVFFFSPPHFHCRLISYNARQMEGIESGETPTVLAAFISPSFPSLPPYPASFIKFFSLRSAFAVNLKHECHRPDTQEREREIIALQPYVD